MNTDSREPAPDHAERARAIVDRYWDELLALDPLLATSVGDDRWDDRLPDPSAVGVARSLAINTRLVDDLAPIDRAHLEPDLRIAVDVANAIAQDAISAAQLRIDRLHLVDHLLGPVSLVGYLTGITVADRTERVDRYCERLAGLSRYLDATFQEMREAQDAGVRWPAAVVKRVLSQVGRLIAVPANVSPLLSPIPDTDQVGRERAAEVVRKSVLPAYVRYLHEVEASARHARSTIGVASIPNGDLIYAASIRRWTTQALEPQDLYELGREEMRRIQRRRKSILRRLGFDTLGEALEAYDRQARTRLVDRESVLHLVQEYVARGWDGTREVFLRMPQTNCVVRLVEEYREPDYPGATYQPPTAERDGLYLVNAGFYLDPNSRMLHRLATTSYHEANPGHHFQASLGQDHAGAPTLRQYVDVIRGDAFAEGWGLYCEQLADEIGLYQDDYERLGQLDNEALRAVRLIVDTGIHAFGWSRSKGIGELLRAGLSRLEAEIEIDRYAVDPAQALCYKVGQLEIARLRSQYVHDAGDLAVFHDRLMSLGALPLETLGRELAAAYQSTRVPGSIGRLAAAARRVAAGHYAERVPSETDDEVGELAAAFNHMSGSLEATERRRLELVGDVAHELRAPLTTLGGYLEALQDGVIEPNEATWTLLRTETGRLNRLVGDLAELWRAEAWQLPLLAEPVEVAPILAALRECYAPEATARQMDVVLDPSDGVVRADADRVTQILANYLSNALRYAPDGSTVRLSARFEGQEVVVAVADEGPGLTAEQVEQVFERFYRPDPSRSRAPDGLGIGLAIARALAEAMGGRAWATSDGPGHGSTFWLALPQA